jgi:probable phosphoglycerate mutase
MPVLYYVRHGLTDWNSEGRLHGQYDVALNKTGRAQAGMCGSILRDLFTCAGCTPADLGYVSSPLIRAAETMEIMRAALDLDRTGYAIEPRLAEIAFGEWEGLTYGDVLKRDADIVAAREGNKWLFRPPGGETYEEVAQRVGAWYATVARDTVVCAHGGTARALVALLGVADPEEAAHHPIEQGCVYVFEGSRVRRYA